LHAPTYLALMVRNARAALAGLVGGCMLAACPAAAQAPPGKQACIDAYDSAQVQGELGRLLAARESLTFCGSAACPDKMRAQCSTELRSLQTRIPSIVLPPSDAAARQIWLDGAPVRAHAGEPIDVDPGMHKLRVQSPQHAAVEQQFEIAPGQQRKAVALPEPGAGDASAPRGPHSTRMSHPALVWGLAGVAALAAGSFAYFGLTGRSEYLQLKDTCAPSCTEDEARASHTKMVIADVSLGVSAAALAAALLVFGFDRASASEPSVGVGLVPGAAAAAMRWVF
jgi:hypothetical protein